MAIPCSSTWLKERGRKRGSGGGGGVKCGVLKKRLRPLTYGEGKPCKMYADGGLLASGVMGRVRWPWLKVPSVGET